MDHFTPLNMGCPENLAGLHALADEAHRFGAKISVELAHGGLLARDELLKDGRRFAVSKLPTTFAPPPGVVDTSRLHYITRQDMKDIIELYCKTAYNLMRADFDMMMLHAGHGWLIWQFLSPTFNQREDEYGGLPLENRMRFPLEVLKAMRETVGNKMAIDMRVTGDTRTKNPNPEMDMAELITFLKAASKYADAVNVSASSATYWDSSEYMCQSYYLPHMTNAEFAKQVKAGDTGLVVSTAGSFVSMEMSEEWLKNGYSDMVGMARALIADDKHVLKAYRGQDDRIRPCIRCAYCTDRLETFEHVRCAVNPFVGRMDEYPQIPLPLAPKSKKLMIIGGGVAGMQAAQIAVSRGHDVTLYEKNADLGGMADITAALPDKYDMRRYMKWMKKETYECGAKVVLNTEVTTEMIAKEAPDAVLVAIGAIPAKLPIPGLYGKSVVLAGFIDTGEVKAGDKVVIAGAGLSGLECAVPLAREGKDVTIVDMLDKKDLLKDASGQIRVSMQRLLNELPIKLVLNVRISSIDNGGVHYTDANGECHYLPADTVVNALGMQIDQPKVDAMMNVVPESFAIGDCNGGRKSIMHALESALAFVMEL